MMSTAAEVDETLATHITMTQCINPGEMIALTECLKRAEGNLADCQNCGTRGASTLSTAYAGFRFTSSLVSALKGAENVIECAFVKSEIIPELEYLASPLKLGIRGVEHNFGYPPLSDYELAGLEQSAAVLLSDIKMGKDFVTSIEETIQKGLIWKRLSEGNGKGVEELKPAVKESERNEKERIEATIRRRRAEEKRMKEREGELEVQPSALTHGVYSEGVRNWAAQSPLKRLFEAGEVVRGDCNEVARDSISADLDSDSCKEDLHDGIQFEGLLEEKPPNEVSRSPSKGIVSLSSYETPKLWRTFRQSSVVARRYHTMQKDNFGLERRNFRVKEPSEKYKRYLMEDRQMMLMPLKEMKPTMSPLVELKPKKPLTKPKRLFRPLKYENKSYKNLNACAKQKFRSFNSQKKFTPSASVLLLLDKKKKERASKNLEIFMSEKKDKADSPEEEKKEDSKENEKEETEDAEKEKDSKNDQKQLIVRTEKDEITKYKEFIFQQLRELKRENEALKKQISALSQDRTLESSLQVQTENLELEKTKLKACWLIMSSTIDAFSNFCKKFSSKSDADILEVDKETGKQEEEDQEDQNTDDDFVDAVENPEQLEEKKSYKYDERYFKFLEKLMEDQMEGRLENDLNRSRMKK